MIYVLDASAALGVAGKYEESVLDRKDVVLVPEIYIAEVTNAVWKNHRILGTPLETCHELLTELLDFPSIVVSGAQIARGLLSWRPWNSIPCTVGSTLRLLAKAKPHSSPETRR